MEEHGSSMNEECHICLEELFDEEGVACNGAVARIMCVHLVHSDCEPVDRSILTVGDMELVASDPVLGVLSVTNQ